MYNNILLFIVVIFLFHVAPQKSATLQWWLGLSLMFVLYGSYYFTAKKVFFRSALRSWDYPKIETVLSWLAVLFYGVLLYFCSPGYYLAKMPLAQSFTVLQGIGGVSLFLFFLVLMWHGGHEFHDSWTGSSSKLGSFIISNLRVNLPVIIPWLLVSFLYDIVALLPFPWLHKAMDSPWSFLPLVLVALFFLPVIIRTLWGCRVMEEGETRNRLEGFCQKLNFSAELYIWPLHEGRALTAAVVGLVPGFRYIMITPALLKLLTAEEMEGVLAHEIGHVRKGHLLLYIVVISCFSIAFGSIVDPLASAVASSSFVQLVLVEWLGFSRSGAITFVGSICALFGMVLFFRFVFGYFIRNFERQADLYSAKALGSTEPLIATFEKLAFYTGGGKKKKDWHHFGLGERIACLHQFERDSGRLRQQDHKVWGSLALYFALLITLSLWSEQKPGKPEISPELSRQLTSEDLAIIQRGIAFKKVEEARWYRHLGDIMIGKNQEREGLASYEKSMQLDPGNPQTVNNLAWLLVASKDLSLRNPERALQLALDASSWEQTGYFYDTLAAVYWANGMNDAAQEAEQKAMRLDPGKASYYRSQALRFSLQSYQEEIQKQRVKEESRSDLKE